MVANLQVNGSKDICSIAYMASLCNLLDLCKVSNTMSMIIFSFDNFSAD